MGKIKISWQTYLPYGTAVVLAVSWCDVTCGERSIMLWHDELSNQEENIVAKKNGVEFHLL